jgi:hypothetical protein
MQLQCCSYFVADCLCEEVQVGGAGLGFGPGSGITAVGGLPGSGAEMMKEPASQRTAAAMEAGFARGGLESTVEGTNAAGMAAPAQARAATNAPSAVPTGQYTGITQPVAQSTPQPQVRASAGTCSVHGAAVRQPCRAVLHSRT